MDLEFALMAYSRYQFTTVQISRFGVIPKHYQPNNMVSYRRLVTSLGTQR